MSNIATNFLKIIKNPNNNVCPVCNANSLSVNDNSLKIQCSSCKLYLIHLSDKLVVISFNLYNHNIYVSLDLLKDELYISIYSLEIKLMGDVFSGFMPAPNSWEELKEKIKMILTFQ